MFDIVNQKHYCLCFDGVGRAVSLCNGWTQLAYRGLPACPTREREINTPFPVCNTLLLLDAARPTCALLMET